MKKLLILFLSLALPAAAAQKMAGLGKPEKKEESETIDTNIDNNYLDQNPVIPKRDYSNDDYIYSQQNKLLLEPEIKYNQGSDDPTRSGKDFRDAEKEFKLKMNLELD